MGKRCTPRKEKWKKGIYKKERKYFTESVNSMIIGARKVDESGPWMITLLALAWDAVGNPSARRPTFQMRLKPEFVGYDFVLCNPYSPSSYETSPLASWLGALVGVRVGGDMTRRILGIISSWIFSCCLQSQYSAIAIGQSRQIDLPHFPFTGFRTATPYSVGTLYPNTNS